MSDFDSTSLRGRGRETLLPEGGLPFTLGPSLRPAASPADFADLSVAEAFESVDWDGAQAAAQEVDLDSLTVGEFFERFSWAQQG